MKALRQTTGPFNNSVCDVAHHQQYPMCPIIITFEIWMVRLVDLLSYVW